MIGLRAELLDLDTQTTIHGEIAHFGRRWTRRCEQKRSFDAFESILADQNQMFGFRFKQCVTTECMACQR